MAKSRRQLSVLKPAQQGLGEPTIMDRSLAARHGAPYVHLAVFAIDVDRLFRLLADDLPLGWELHVTAKYLALERESLSLALLEETCRAAIAAAGEVLGSQLPFAAHRALELGHLPAELGHLFRRWGRRAKPLEQGLRELEGGGHETLSRLCHACLGAELTPPIAEPTRRALEKLARAAVPAD